MNINKLYEENQKEFEEIDKIINEEGVLLFGAAARGYFDSDYLLKNNYKVNCFIDNDINKHNKELNGLKIYSINNNIVKNSKAVLITNDKSIKEIGANIKNNTKAKYMTFDKWFILKNFNQILNFINLLDDEISKIKIEILIYSKIMQDISFCHKAYDDNQYFCISKFKYYSPNEIFVDCGAFTGDTIEKFISNNYGSFSKIYAFEPCIKQFNAMKNRVNRLKKEYAIDNNKIFLINSGLSNESKNAYITNDFLGSYISEYSLNTNTKLIKLDDFLNNSKITFLKADIEGYELNMLKGAVNTIKLYKPKMAISVYHKPDDLLTIPKFIKDLVPEYKFALRHHSIGFDETVLYCWID